LLAISDKDAILRVSSSQKGTHKEAPMKRTIVSIALCLVLTITIHYLGPKGETLEATVNTATVMPTGVFGFPEGFESISEWSLFIPMRTWCRM
jgi:hypothetical protein